MKAFSRSQHHANNGVLFSVCVVFVSVIDLIKSRTSVFFWIPHIHFALHIHFVSNRLQWIIPNIAGKRPSVSSKEPGAFVFLPRTLSDMCKGWDQVVSWGRICSELIISVESLTAGLQSLRFMFLCIYFVCYKQTYLQHLSWHVCK